MIRFNRNGYEVNDILIPSPEDNIITAKPEKKEEKENKPKRGRKKKGE